jgi:hypothetical protein
VGKFIALWHLCAGIFLSSGFLLRDHFCAFIQWTGNQHWNNQPIIQQTLHLLLNRVVAVVRHGRSLSDLPAVAPLAPSTAEKRRLSHHQTNTAAQCTEGQAISMRQRICASENIIANCAEGQRLSDPWTTAASHCRDLKQVVSMRHRASRIPDVPGL